MVDLDRTFQLQYSRSAAFWQLLDMVASNQNVFAKKRKAGIGTLFWGAHQRFFRNMLMAAKVCSTPSVACAASVAKCMPLCVFA